MNESTLRQSDVRCAVCCALCSVHHVRHDWIIGAMFRILKVAISVFIKTIIIFGLQMPHSLSEKLRK